jgi:hypothetical protein
VTSVFNLSGNLNRINRDKNRRGKCAARRPLAIATVAIFDRHWIGFAFVTDGSAHTTAGKWCRHQIFPPGVSFCNHIHMAIASSRMSGCAKLVRETCNVSCDICLLSVPLVRLPLIRLAQLSEIELFHSEERLRHARDLLGRAVAHYFIHLGRNDLPREAEFVLEPAALFGFRNGG